jgi:Spy/CpxP family protein refolding chaperone
MRIRGTRSALVIALMLLCFAGVARAQLEKLENTTPEQRAKALTAIMKTKLTLGPEQTAKVAELNLKYAQQMEPVIKGSEGRFMKMMKMKEINGQKEAELHTILSPDQFAKYQASKEEMREKFEEKLEEKSKGSAQ